MDLSLEIKDTKIILKWADKKNADCYKVFCKKNDVFYECAKVFNENQIKLSLAPYGDGECFIQAIKDGKVVDESSRRQYKFDTIDVVTRFEGENDLKIFYSKCENAQGYRLYKSEDEQGFGGCKNSDAEFVSIENTANTEYKIKPFIKTEQGREFLTSSSAFKPQENRFVSTSLYKSYNFNFFLSWNFKGNADGFLVYTQNSNTPIFETNDGLRHYLELTEFKGSTKYIIKAFVNTFDGRLIIAESPLTSLNIRKYEKPEVSLIIPAYNSKDYIARSIDSALASDFENLEIIIVNDGSTDDTQKIIDWYDKNYENIVSIQKENGGVADSRNTAIKAAKGDYIAFLDNDDLVRPDMISSLYNTITKNDCDVAIAPLYRITDSGYTIHCN
ncbi:glycosyltransferase family 2 protein [bacterium]|nr:glycosyltransferase family 2 protein [bacterium]